MFGISDLIDPARIVKDGEQRDDFHVCPGLSGEFQAILKNPCPMSHAVIAAEWQGVVFEDGLEDWLEVHQVILATTIHPVTPNVENGNLRDIMSNEMTITAGEVNTLSVRSAPMQKL